MERKSMAVPLVSVITPVYNGAEHIAACISSVAHIVTAGRIAVEHIIIDDGSTDGSISAANEAIASCSSGAYEGRLISMRHSGKPAYARNRGIEAAKGEYIFCLDHDDIVLQNSLRYLASHLEPSVKEVVYGDFLRGDSTASYQIGNDYHGWPHPNGAAALCAIFKGDHFYQHSFMFTKSLWRQVGGYDEAITFGEDLDLCIRFILAGQLPIHVPVTTHIHRNHGKNLSAGYADHSAWPAEVRSHYLKYEHQLPGVLSPEQLREIHDYLAIEESTLDRTERQPTTPSA